MLFCQRWFGAPPARFCNWEDFFFHPSGPVLDDTHPGSRAFERWVDNTLQYFESPVSALPLLPCTGAPAVFPDIAATLSTIAPVTIAPLLGVRKAGAGPAPAPGTRPANFFLDPGLPFGTFDI